MRHENPKSKIELGGRISLAMLRERISSLKAILSLKQSLIIALPVVAVAIAIFFFVAHRNRPQPQPDDSPDVQPGEPSVYSATVIRTIDDGSTREESVTRVVRSGDFRREEWPVQGATRALIFRPDLGKVFLLALNKREYVEMNIGPVGNLKSQADAPGEWRNHTDAVDPNSIDRAINNAPSPVSVEARTLADQTIENHPCRVTERRALFADGHVETTRTFLARDLSGLALRVETESTASGVKVITERRDVRVEVSPDEFSIPAGFKKVERLIH